MAGRPGVPRNSARLLRARACSRTDGPRINAASRRRDNLRCAGVNSSSGIGGAGGSSAKNTASSCLRFSSAASRFARRSARSCSVMVASEKRPPHSLETGEPLRLVAITVGRPKCSYSNRFPFGRRSNYGGGSTVSRGILCGEAKNLGAMDCVVVGVGVAEGGFADNRLPRTP